MKEDFLKPLRAKEIKKELIIPEDHEVLFKLSKCSQIHLLTSPSEDKTACY
jgi:hypothetical protein